MSKAQVKDLNSEVIYAVQYHTNVRDLNLEYMGDILGHTRVRDIFLEVIMASPDLSPQPTIPYFSLFFET